MKVLVTGAAGFIGHHVCRRLVDPPGRAEVLGVDNLSAYYDPALKRARVAQLDGAEDFRFVQADFTDRQAFPALCAGFKPDYVVHLGAQAGVRHSIDHPHDYADANLVGFLNVLEACRRHPVRQLVYASSSSVYGAGAVPPFREDRVGEPLSLYAATKRANEHMAHAYAHVHGVPVVGLRFFTVYGPWGRPDMTPILFARAITTGQPIRLFNHGLYRRDFTYVDDIVDGVLRALLYPPAEPPRPPSRIYNLGHHRPVEMRLFVEMLESLLGRKALVELLPPQPTEMPETCADLTRAGAELGYRPRVTLDEGLRRFVEWFRGYYGA